MKNQKRIMELVELGYNKDKIIQCLLNYIGETAAGSILRDLNDSNDPENNGDEEYECNYREGNDFHLY